MMVQLSNEQLMRILLEDEDNRCPQCGSTGAHFCPGKPLGNDWLDFKHEVEAGLNDNPVG